MEALLGNWLLLVCAGLLLLWFILNFRKSSRHVKNLHQKAVLITGCDSGFGHELTKRLDSHGVTVYAGVLFPDGPGAGRLKEVCSSRLQILHMDVTKEDHIAEAVKAVTDTLGDKKLWAIVNNAGISTGGGFEWTPIEKIKNVLDVNTLGPVRVSAAFLPLLKLSRGRIVIVASLSGHHCVPAMSAYNMSKFAAVAFGDTIRRELRNWSVSVHLINPTLYRTNISDPNHILKELKTNWESANIVKSTYPNNFLSNYEKLQHIFTSFAKPGEDICEVINDMEHAVIGLHPKISYYPGIAAKVTHFIFNVCPVSILDYLFAVVLPSNLKDSENRVLSFMRVIFYNTRKK